MATEVKLYVLRPRKELELGLPSNSPLAWDEHRQRAAWLHELLDDSPDWRVTDWGDTDDEVQPHESVKLLVEWIVQAGPAAGAVALSVGGIVLAKAVDVAAGEAVRGLIGRLAGKVRKGDAAEARVTLSGGSEIRITPAKGSKIQIKTLENGVFGASAVVTIDELAPPAS